ncbi:uncharacterized protein B0I36DRAFT_70038 [Microdochium trichocladiopsis]|uniref:Uncharacterized protein n=1 Tax=Microdochium trichocladiopsis TaxID=1682393 RepID=A0A9P8YEE7_9PEZI|nr:uncharacterized protein B0I36DRAFT_70038 [Microdochium trichocladiopsis]KAH7037714.1 hypothetical protein B0I36DRAFT_70038 [Microdochium trichocladiopsis]
MDQHCFSRSQLLRPSAAVAHCQWLSRGLHALDTFTDIALNHLRRDASLALISIFFFMRSTRIQADRMHSPRISFFCFLHKDLDPSCKETQPESKPTTPASVDREGTYLPLVIASAFERLSTRTDLSIVTKGLLSNWPFDDIQDFCSTTTVMPTTMNCHGTDDYFRPFCRVIDVKRICPLLSTTWTKLDYRQIALADRHGLMESL